MANSKITSLSELTTKPEDTDMFVVVDVSDTSMNGTGTNKKLAGDMLVRTNGTVNTLDDDLTIFKASARVNIDASSSNPVLYFAANGVEKYHLYYNVGNQRLSFVETGVAETVHFKAGGNVGIGNSSPSYTLDVSGAVHASSFPTSSDIRLKDNVRRFQLNNSIKQKLNAINAYLFEWKDEYTAVEQFKSNGVEKDTQIGFIAQEVREAVPQLVTEWRHAKTVNDTDENIIEDALAVDYTRFIPILWEAVKELYQENAELKQRMTSLGV